MQIKSKEIKTAQNLYEGYFKIERDGEIKEIDEPLIINEDIAQQRAIAEFLEFGYEKQEVEFTTYFSSLKINDIISIYSPKYRIPKDLTKDRFIVKNIKHKFKDGRVLTTIKAVRYD